MKENFLEVTDKEDNLKVCIKVKNIVSIAEVQNSKCSIKVYDGIQTYFINTIETYQEILNRLIAMNKEE